MPDTQPTIPAEAVEAAARALYEFTSGEVGWTREYESVRIIYRDKARQAITAALPHLPQHVSPSPCCATTEQVHGHWLVEAHDHCTCGDGGPMGHEPGCGMTPLVDLAGLSGWDSTVEQVRREALLSAADEIERGVLDGIETSRRRAKDSVRSRDRRGAEGHRSGSALAVASRLRARAAEGADRG